MLQPPDGSVCSKKRKYACLPIHRNDTSTLALAAQPLTIHCVHFLIQFKKLAASARCAHAVEAAAPKHNPSITPVWPQCPSAPVHKYAYIKSAMPQEKIHSCLCLRCDGCHCVSRHVCVRHTLLLELSELPAITILTVAHEL